MSKTPVFTGKELIKSLIKLEFSVVRIKGSHHFMRHKDGRFTTVPVHAKETVGTGLLNKILKDCEITIKDLK
ncbi:MAG: type II toxin-antitoxin system HicA family toxin [Ignavibacteriae bacterium]|nr:type II toxin-antitoxin system HicA family toxin [Ignavibacteriota bacterium]